MSLPESSVRSHAYKGKKPHRLVLDLKALAVLAATASLVLVAPAPASASWKVAYLANKWGEPSNTRVAITAWTATKYSLDPPYSNIRARIVVSENECRRPRLWLSSTFNLTGGKRRSFFFGTEDEISYLASTRINRQKEDVVRLYRIGTQALYWTEDDWMTANTFEILVPFPDESGHWEFDMTGAVDAINEVCPHLVEISTPEQQNEEALPRDAP